MKDSRAELNRMLGGLLLFCVVAALFYVHNEEPTIQAAIDAVQTNTNSEFSSQDLVKNIMYLVQSGNVKAIGELLAPVSVAQAKEVLNNIINDGTISLSPSAKLQLIFAVAVNYVHDQQAHTDLFNLVSEHPELFKDFSPIYFAAAHGHSNLIALLEQWAQAQKSTDSQLSALMAHAVFEGMRHAIINNNVAALNDIFAHASAIAPKQVSDLLWFAVSQAKDPAFVQLLIDRGADVNMSKDGYSLLAKAVTTKKLPLVQAIVQAHPKPNINALHAAAVGTPLQLAIQEGLADIDQYLREHGARE